MTIEADLYTKLTGASAVSDLVGTRVYPLNLPQKPAYPAVTYQRISTVPVKVMGTTSARVALMQARFQIDAWASTPDGATALADAVFAAIEGWSKTAATAVRDTALDNRIEDFEEGLPAPGLFRVIQDFLITYAP